MSNTRDKVADVDNMNPAAANAKLGTTVSEAVDEHNKVVVSHTDLVDAHNALAAKFDALTAKLDTDEGTDSDYASTIGAAGTMDAPADLNSVTNLADR